MVKIVKEGQNESFNNFAYNIVYCGTFNACGTLKFHNIRNSLKIRVGGGIFVFLMPTRVVVLQYFVVMIVFWVHCGRYAYLQYFVCRIRMAIRPQLLNIYSNVSVRGLGGLNFAIFKLQKYRRFYSGNIY